MQYQCLRDCWVTERLFRKGEVYNLPDEMPKAEKNFRLVGEPAIAREAPEATMGVTPIVEPPKTDTVDVPTETEVPAPPVAVKSNTCVVCGKVCKNPFGLRSHMKKHNK